MNRPNGGGVLRFPQAVAYGPGGQTVIVGDEYSARISVFGAAGDFRFAFGSRAARREDGRLGVVGGVATDRAGNVFVLDSEHDRIQVFDAAGHHRASFGDNTVFSLLDADPEAAGGISAGGIAVAPGVVYVADPSRDRIVRIPFDAASNTFGVPTFSTVDLAAPQGVALDPANTALYVADDVHDRVVVLDPVTLALRAQVGSHGSGPGQFDAPYDVAVDATRRLYVADNLNGRVDVFSADSLAWLGFIGRDGRGLPPEMTIVRAVGGIADDPGGGIAIADTANNRVQTYGPAGNVLAAWGIQGRGPGYFTRPRGVAVAPGGGVTVADTFDHRVVRMGADGAYESQVGLVSGGTGYTYGGGADGQLSLPRGVAYDAAGTLWIADTGNDRVLAVDAAGAIVRTIGGLDEPQAVAAGPDGSVLVADTGHGDVIEVDGPALTRHSGFTRPIALAFDGTDVFVADAAGVRTLAGTSVAAPGGGAWDTVTGIAASSGVLAVAERRPGTANGARVVRRDAGGWNTIAAEGTGDGDVIEPAGLALSADAQTLYVADAGNNRVLRFDAPGVTPPRPSLLRVAVDAIALGRVTSDRPGIECPTDCSQHYGTGTTVTLTATPAAGFVFAGWTGACAGTAPCAVPMGVDQAVGASFVPAPPLTPVVPPPPPPRPPAVRVSGLRVSPKVLQTRSRVSLRLSRPATLTVTLQVARDGRRRGSRCVAPTRALRHRARCTRYVSLRGHRTLKASGAYAFTLTRRFAGLTLKPGKYRVAVTALDAAGNRVGPATAAFTVRRPRRA
ncbi:NHL repeat-containing protein [Solirubrobacter ginsenosidimutans]|uniref:NHL repeat-containing protein n=1 Tax=Solirubrobacter ginsenosidimutans TaxID=490573 RepID=A0A9X3MRB2_9ACTN|nr:NHL repeat-containing protein [Solirubrobacter ginsenosidimutans]MDA0161149.1 NHL repeat-containing protein [Solirubrobacter ginsenosidimutans]